jgi:transcriptional regulator with XRE-family HTH domain
MLFGRRLLTERKKKGLSAEAVAKLCSISRSYVTLIEKGKRLPGKKVIPKIAKALEVETNTVVHWYLEDIREKIH